MNDCSSFGYLYYLKLSVFKFRDLDPSAGLEQADIADNAMINLGIHDIQSWYSHVYIESPAEIVTYLKQ